MRSDYQRQLEGLSADLGRMCELAGSAVGHATDALLSADDGAVGRVVADVDQLRLIDSGVQRRAVSILACQAPVARDLRAVVSAIQISADANRMGGLAAHVGRKRASRTPADVVPAELRPQFTQMGALAVDLADRCRQAVLVGDAALTHRILHDDEAMEQLHRDVYRVVMNAKWAHGAAMAIDVVLLGRFYGRFADHAGEIARRVQFQTTGSTARGDALV